MDESPRAVPSVFDTLTETAINETIASAGPQWRRRNAVVFAFARHLLGHPQWQDYTAADLEPHLRRWYEACADYVIDPGGEPLAWDEVWTYFGDLWDHRRMHTPAGDQWALALQVADRFERPELAGLPPNVQRLGRILYALALGNTRGECFCTQAQAGSIVRGHDGKDPGTRMLGRAVLDILVRRGVLAVRAPARGKRSARYAYAALQGDGAAPATMPALDPQSAEVLRQLQEVWDTRPLPEDAAEQGENATKP
jgi:hypothetical protein